jgi:lipid-A-disaccharide synthase
MKYYLVAGERSGDLHGGNLLRALGHLDPALQCRGFGGDEMQAAGMHVTVHYRDMEMMGFLSLTFHLPRIFRYIDQCQRDLQQFQPDVIVLIDYGGFNMRIAKFAHQQGFRVFYYIPPKIWAWYQGRARKLHAWVERLFLILPFETSFYARYGLKGDYVGNPVLDAIKTHVWSSDFLERNPLPQHRPIVALLPGSRRGELKRIVPVMAELARLKPHWHFVVAAVRSLPDSCYQSLMGIGNVSFVWEDTYNLLRHAQAAVVTSGTATLETALLNVPQVVVYKTGTLEYKIARSLVQVPFISLVNLIADQQVVRELIQTDCTPEEIAAEVDRLLNDPPYRSQVLHAYQRIYTLLDVGSASENTARLMVKYLAEQA